MQNNKTILKKIDYIYNPDNQSKEELISGFVVRLKTFDRLFQDIKNSSMVSPEQHYLIEGKRGMGKTTMLLRLGYQVENDKSLNTWLIPIVFNEEEYSIRRLYKLWERIAVFLEEKSNEFLGLMDTMDSSFNNYASEEEYEYNIFILLNNYLEKNKKKTILFIDNFGDIFKKFNDQEIQRLRTILQTNTNIRIFGASSNVLEAFYDNKHPFFELFKVTRLVGLDKVETKELLLKLGESYKQEQLISIIESQPGRVEALRRLTGGVIRTIVLLSEIFIDKELGNAFSDLEAILDRVTPLYKHRMDDLPPQQQAIVEAIAFSWDAINVSEISQKTKILSKTVSAQLSQMEKNEIITKKLTTTKNHFYQISERFFNIWYLMRHGRKGDKRKVLWLVRFLEEWCDEAELISRAKRHVQLLEKGDYNIDGAYYFTEALASTKSLPEKSQDELIKATRMFLSKNNSDFALHLSDSDLEIQDRASKCYIDENYEEALKIYLKANKKDDLSIGICYRSLKKYKEAEKYLMISAENGNVVALRNLGIMYQYDLKDYKEAERYYLKAVEFNDAIAMRALGLLYTQDLKEYKKAEKYILMGIKENDTPSLTLLALLYAYELKKYKEAEKYYMKSINAGALNCFEGLALLYHYKLKDYDKAEEYYLKAIENKSETAYLSIGKLYKREKQEYDKAEKYYLKAFEIGTKEAYEELGDLYMLNLNDFEKAEKYYLIGAEKKSVHSYVGLGDLYNFFLKDFTKAEIYYLKAIEKKHKDAMRGLATLYRNELGRYDESETLLLKAIKGGDKESLRELAYLYSFNFKNYDKAEEYYLKAIKNKDVDSMRGIAVFYTSKKIDLKKAEHYFLMAIDNGDIYSISALAQFYFEELNDIEKAKKYFLKGVEKNDIDSIFGLAKLYDTLLDYINAELYYKKGIELGDSWSMNNLAFIYYSQFRNKEMALELAEKAYSIENDDANTLTYAKVLLWNDKISESKNISNVIMFNEKFLTEYIEYFSDYLYLLMAKNEYRFLFDYLTSKLNDVIISDFIKPIWYTLMFYMKKEYPNEFLRMGEELEETVNEIIEKIEKMRINYR